MEIFRRIGRTLDLIFVNSDRAQQAQAGARIHGVSMEAMYDGGMGVQVEHILPEYKSGKPPVQEETRVRVGRLDGHGALMVMRAIYDPVKDAFRVNDNQHANHSSPRTPGDLRLLDSDYELAFDRAVR